MGLIEDQQALADALADVLEQRVTVLGAAQGLKGNDEAVVRAPGVHAEAALLAAAADEPPVVHLEVQTEPLLHLVAPLQGHGCRADDEREVDPLAQQQLLQDQSSLDRLAEPDIVGNEQVCPWQLQRLLERRELVVHQLDARSKRGLEELGVRGCDRVPLQGVEVCAKVARGIELADIAQTVGLWLEYLRA